MTSRAASAVSTALERRRGRLSLPTTAPRTLISHERATVGR
jgi:hypothetical protein